MDKGAQAAAEYMFITGFMLVVIAIIFSFAIISQDENMKIRRTNDSMASLVNTADEVYAHGPGNVLYTKVNWPDGVEQISLQHRCNNGDVGSGDTYCDARGGIDYSAIMVSVRFFGGSDEIMYESRAPLYIDERSDSFPIESGEHIVRVGWIGVGGPGTSKVSLSRG